jgi:PAS domain S-box-containing protein
VEDRLKDDLAWVRKGADEALCVSEARYRRLFEAAQDGILILDGHSGLITDVNPFLVSLLDYPREEFIGKTLWDIGPFRNIEASKSAFRELQQEGYVRYDNLPLEARTGRRVCVAGNNVPQVVGNPEAIVAQQFDMRANPTTGL